jgi:hypothetical protein
MSRKIPRILKIREKEYNLTYSHHFQSKFLKVDFYLKNDEDW